MSFASTQCLMQVSEQSVWCRLSFRAGMGVCESELESHWNLWKTQAVLQLDFFLPAGLFTWREGKLKPVVQPSLPPL